MDIQETPTAIIVAVIGGGFMLMNTLLSKLLQAKADKVDDTTMLKNMKVSEKGREFRHKYGIDRLNCVFYHNGGYYYSGESQDKFTLRYEFVKDGVTKIQPIMTGVPASLLEDMPMRVKDEIILVDFNVLSRVKEMKENKIPLSPGYYGLLSDYGVDASVVKGVFKKVFQWDRLWKFQNPYSLELVATIHIHWGEESKGFLKTISEKTIHRGEFINELSELADVLVEDKIDIQQFEKMANLKLHNLH